jgi:Protein of unknown function (DUF3060)
MKPEDDPEARIRELERPLAETARASEAGGTQGGIQAPGGYTYPPGPAGPPPAPPVNYGASFPPTAPRSFSFSRMWWILIASFVIVPMAIAGFIAVNPAHRLSHSGLTTLSPTPGVSPSAGPNSPPNTGTQTPGAGPTTSPPSGPLPPAGGNLSVAGINKSQTITCNESIVDVSGVSNKVVISGHCKSLSVSGVQNSVTVDAVDTIEASGFNNQITYHTGSPSIDKSGEGNVVQQG